MSSFTNLSQMLVLKYRICDYLRYIDGKSVFFFSILSMRFIIVQDHMLSKSDEQNSTGAC